MLAFSPSIGAFGRPKALTSVRSRSLYPGRLNELRLIWLGGSAVPEAVPVKTLKQLVVTVAEHGTGMVKYAAAPLEKFDLATVLKASMLVLLPALPREATGNIVE